MLVFNEGNPRSGKSYDAIKNHVLPALKAGRRVYARIKGLDDRACRAAIAAYLGWDASRLDGLLIYLAKSDVLGTFRAVEGADDWEIPAALQNAVFVIDEIHDYYVASRQPIDPAIENFFALHGQNGMDGVIMTQYWRRLHSSVRCRVERKNLFRKQTAVGMKGSYLETHYQASGPERFEKVSSETHQYDSQIFPMYKGYADGVVQTEVYASGGVNVWKVIRKWSFVMVPILIVAIWFLWHFFSSSGSDMFTKSSAQHHVTPPVAPLGVAAANRAGATAVPQVVAASPVPTLQPHFASKALSVMPEAVRYVFTLCSTYRPRLAASIVDNSGGEPLGEVEWPQDAATLADRLTFSQLRDMGVSVSLKSYGVVLSWGQSSVLVTSWPMVEPAAPSPDSQAPQDQNGQRSASTLDASTQQATGTDRALNHPVGMDPPAYVPPEYGKWDPQALQ